MSTPTTQTHTRQVDLNNESVTGHAGEEMLQRSAILKTPPTTPLRILDNASGAGGLLFRLLNHITQLPPSQRPTLERIIAGDTNPNILASIPRRIQAENLPFKIETLPLDQQDASSLPSSSFTHIFNNFGAFFAPNEQSIFSETLRLLQPGGLAGFTSWKSTAWPDEILFPALKAYLPEAPQLPHPGELFGTGWNDEEAVRRKLMGAGFVDVEVGVVEFTPDLAGDVEGWAESLSFLTLMLARKAWGQEGVERFGPRVKPALIRYMEENFEGGRWRGKMVAVVALGRKAA